MKPYLIVAVFALLAGCGEDPLGPIHAGCDDFLLQYGATTGDTIESSAGLQYVEVELGSGDPASAGMFTDVNYSGYLLNGTRFDTSCPASRTVLRFRIGASEVIPGFELGVSGMRPGGIRRVIIPPHLGYGNTANGPIPANSTLVFDLELVGIVGR